MAALLSALQSTNVTIEEVTVRQIAQFNSPEIDLSLKNLTSLPSEVTKLTQIQSLELFGNSLDSLPPEVKQLTELHTLGI